MPLVCIAAIAYAGGLAIAAFSPELAKLFAGAAALAAVALAVHSRLSAQSSAVTQPRLPHTALLAISAAASTVMLQAGTQDKVCASSAYGVDTLHVVLHESVSGRGRVQGTAIIPGSGCRIPARLSVQEGAAGAGDVVRVSGDPSVVRRWGRTAFRMDGAVIEPAGRAELLPRLRASAHDMIVRRFGPDAPLVLALVAAEGQAVDRETRNRYADAGLVHILSVSGLHVAVIGAAIQLLAAVAGMRPRPALATGAIAAAVYVVLIGAPPAAVRSAGMLSMSVAGRLFQRPTSPWTGLGVGGAVPLLIEPRLISHPGWQLSVSGMVGLVLAATVRRRWLSGRLDGISLTIAESILASTAATLTTAPLVAWHFGRISLAGLLSNLFAAPIIGILQPTLFLALLLDPVPMLAAFVADAARPLLRGMDAIATYAAAAPGAAFDMQPSLAAAVITCVLIAALIAAVQATFPGRALVVAVASMAALVWLPQLPRLGFGTAFAELHVLDVGQGDAIAVRTPAGRWVLVDAGASWPGGDEGRRTVVPYLSRKGGRIEAFVLTHPDADHVGGAAAVLDRLRPDEFWDGAYVAPGTPYREALRVAQERGISWRRVSAGDSLLLDGVLFKVLSPDPAWLAENPGSNDASVVLLVQFGAVRFLLVGDAEAAQESWLVRRDSAALRADVLKVGHHGSKTSTGARFLNAVNPRLAVVSVGAGNRFGHPAPEVVSRLTMRGIPLWRTDRLGPIVLRTDGSGITILADDDRWDY
ncbi:MAG TPA: DNA internalization-related competence protein ComEC/Rec2 [Gemmatimonadales bacterium]|nr:DNA internalization-related competence protein ComEC/Rec2 [Gemmatimonadales bacterium]